MYNEMNVLELSEQEIIRRNSMNELRAMGIDPYPAAEYVTNAFSTDIKAEFKDDAEPRKVSVAGLQRSHSGVYHSRRYLSGRRQGTLQYCI